MFVAPVVRARVPRWRHWSICSAEPAISSSAPTTETPPSESSRTASTFPFVGSSRSRISSL
jgi:hypothetical protein